MLDILLAALQAATQPMPAAESGPAPDIQLQVRADIREVRVRQRGQASLTVSGGPGSEVRVEASPANGSRRLRNVRVQVDAEARIAPPGEVVSADVEVNADADATDPDLNRDEDATVAPE